jgi:rSAM/selenodomain-associated transferase 1
MTEQVVAALRSGDQTFAFRFFLDRTGFEKECREWLQTGVDLRLQSGRDLGKRMTNAFQATFAEGFGRAVLVGTDIPAITKTIVQEAFLQLEAHDVVMGKALDGGYYLIGQKTNHDIIFKNIEWSTNTVFAQTLALIRAQGLTCALTPELPDIDTWEDLEHEGLCHYTRPE